MLKPTKAERRRWAATLRKAREARGMTQGALALLSGYSLASVRGIEQAAGGGRWCFQRLMETCRKGRS